MGNKERGEESSQRSHKRERKLQKSDADSIYSSKHVRLREMLLQKRSDSPTPAPAPAPQKR